MKIIFLSILFLAIGVGLFWYLDWRNNLICKHRQRAIEWIFDQPCGSEERISVQARYLEEYNKISYLEQFLRVDQWKFQHFFPYIPEENSNGVQNS